MGYPEGVKGYRVRDKVTGTFFNSRDIIFDESCAALPGAAPIEFFELSAVPASSALSSPSDTLPSLPVPPVEGDSLLPVSDRISSCSSLTSLPSSSSTVSSSSIVSSSACPSTLPVVSRVRSVTSAPVAPLRPPSSRTRAPTSLGELHSEVMAASKARREKLATSRMERLRDSSLYALADPPCTSAHIYDDDCVNLVCSESAFLSIRSNRPRNPASSSYDLKVPPATYSEAMHRPDFDVWEGTVVKELNTLQSMGVYALTHLPPGCKAIGNRWVFELKIDGDSLVQKGRLVAKGFHQIPHVDFGKTFAPVAKTASIRLVAALACQHGWHLQCFDATRAFLWGELEEELFMALPDGFRLHKDTHLPEGCVDESGLVMRLLRSIYGLKQASNIWYKKL